MERCPCNHVGIEEGAHIIHSVDCNETGNVPQAKELLVSEIKTPEKSSDSDAPVRTPISTGT